MSSLQKLQYWLGVAIVPLLVLRMLIVIPGALNLKLALIYVGVSLVTRSPIALSNQYLLHLFVLSAYAASGLVRGELFDNSMVRYQFTLAVQTLVCVPFLAGSLNQTRRFQRYIRDTTRGIAVVGTLGAAAGLGKLLLETRGVQFESLISEDGRYPLGTALQSDYNVCALAMLFALSCALWLRTLVQARFGERLLAALAIPLIALSVLLSGSRRGIAFLGVLATLYCVVLAWRAPTSRRRLSVVIPLVALAAVGLILWGVLQDTENAITSALRPHLTLEPITRRLQTLGSRQDLVSSRAPKLAYAWQLFTQDYGSRELLLGSGFTYLSSMGAAFATPTGFDHPHNMIVSALLYGGITQAALLLALLWFGTRYYVRHRVLLWPQCVAFALALLFSLSSSDSVYHNQLLYWLLTMSAFPFVLDTPRLRPGEPTSKGTPRARTRAQARY